MKGELVTEKMEKNINVTKYYGCKEKRNTLKEKAWA